MAKLEMASLARQGGDNGDGVDFSTKIIERFRKVITLIGKTVSKKPKSKKERTQFAKIVQGNEQMVFELIRGESQPIIFIFRFLEYLHVTKKAGKRVGGRMLYYLSRVLYDQKMSDKVLLQQYATKIILNQKVDYSFYADIILYLDLIRETKDIDSDNWGFSMERVIEIVQEMFEYEKKTCNNYCHATVHTITKLCLHDHFDPATLIEPLINCKNQNVISLQNLLCKNHSKYQTCLIYYTWKVKGDLKRTTKLIKMFGIDPYTNYPEVVRLNTESQLRWIIREGVFDLARSHLEKFDNTTTNGVIANERTIRYLCQYAYKKLPNDHPVLQSWVQLYRNRKYQHTNINEFIFATVKSPPADFVVCNFDDPNTNPSQYLNVCDYFDPSMCITFVDSREKALLAYEHLSKSDAVGFDSEWRPATDVFNENDGGMEIFQISTMDHCYLFDCQLDKLRTYVDLLVTLMNNVQIKKIGYAVAGDTSKLRSTIDRALRSSFGEIGSKRQKTGDFAAIVDIRENKIPGGLAGLVKHYMGKPLKKTQQMSDWSRRPLIYEQVVYAALDAYVCVHIYNLKSEQR